METQLLQQKCSIPKWAREGALRQSTEGWSQADYQLAWEQASSSDALTVGGFIVFLANKILAEVGLHKSGWIWKGMLYWKREKGLGSVQGTQYLFTLFINALGIGRQGELT